jgi:oxygen-independent coproporphyrinogen-3 oxidase
MSGFSGRRIAEDMTQDLVQRYGGAAPRYTSYPTAPHFSSDVGEEVYRARLAALPVTEPVSLYVHVPYCDTLCWFCGCHTKITRQYGPVGKYVDLLIREMELLAEALPGPMRMSHMHWGGGSPTLLTAEDSLRLADAARALFRPAFDFEFAVEIDPRETGKDRIAALAHGGLTRASIGVQDFDPQVQRAINRMQSFEETRAVVAALRAEGVRSLNLDLMYGLPYQTLSRTLATIRKALSLRPDRVALFGYAHVPWMKTHQRMIPEEALPGPEARLEAAEAAAELLVAEGYEKIGIDHFALPGDSMAAASSEGVLRRNFQGYTTDLAHTLLPVGASAIGRLPDLFIQNEPSLKSHARAIEEGRLPAARGVRLDADDRLRADVIERLMCDFAVDLDPICAAHGADAQALLRDAEARLADMEADGILIRQGNRLRMTEVGQPFVRQVAACFDRYFTQGAARHSSTV